MSIWQTEEWSEMLIKSHQVDKVFDINWVSVEKRKVSLWESGLFVQALDFNADIKNELIDLCKKELCLFVQIETLNYESDFKPIKNFKNWCYKKFMPAFTVIIDLKKTEEEILAQMKPKWRYNIKLARKKAVTCKIVDKTKQNIKAFYDLFIETTSRDNFVWNTQEFYEIFLNEIKSSKLIFAYLDDKVISAWIFTFWETEAIYYYWASSSEKEYRNLMAPYLLQWTAIKEAKNRGCKIYDFLWIMTPWDKDSSLKGVTDFKLKFNKQSIKVSEWYIFINKKAKYLLISILRKIFKK